MPFAVAIHGGAGLIRRSSLTPERQERCLVSLRRITISAAEALEQGASALDVAIGAVVALEDDPLFNAGHGAVLASHGEAELDAAVMEGTHRAAGAVAAARTPRNPVQLAHAVMVHTPHVLLAAEGADALAEELRIPQVDPSYFVVEARREQLQRARASGRFHLDHGGADKDVYGTVGAVACDATGAVAAATSTGGMVNKRPGRVGDTPVIGAGTFAWNDTCAVSGTGHGEPFLRLGVASRVSARMELAGESLATAAEHVIHRELPGVEGQGGLVAVDAQGNLALPFNTAGMFRGWARQGQPPDVAIW
ncbi:MAG: isoaspartyl peptidase/L-asparaginase [Myxococcales bacterium]|nr:isoaspartyl peptidase/L-asparaginase [Myxococcales bacterium]